jgi:hypothetical protein
MPDLLGALFAFLLSALFRIRDRVCSRMITKENMVQTFCYDKKLVLVILYRTVPYLLCTAYYIESSATYTDKIRGNIYYFASW